MHTRSFDTERAVSPVIGVILMVAITVLLAATAAVFFTGFQDETQQGPPGTAFSIEYDANAETIGGSPSDTVTISHQSGDTLTAGDLVVDISGTAVDGQYDYESFTTSDGTPVGEESQITAGDEIQIGAGDFSGASTVDFSNAEVTVIWTSGSGTQEINSEDFS
jgi:flagellin-like protein